MSVAFRRDSDEEHREPRFELPIPPGENLVTARGLSLIRDQVTALEAKVAAAEGAAREPLARELRYWRAREATARLAPPPPADTVAFGSRVRILRDGRTQLVEIVGHDEAEPAAGRIAWGAPLARALMGAGVGDRADFAGKAEAIEIVGMGATA